MTAHNAQRIVTSHFSPCRVTAYVIFLSGPCALRTSIRRTELLSPEIRAHKVVLRWGRRFSRTKTCCADTHSMLWYFPFCLEVKAETGNGGSAVMLCCRCILLLVPLVLNGRPDQTAALQMPGLRPKHQNEAASLDRLRGPSFRHWR